ncbi:MAG: uncharacterized protein KVP18_000800 [Porospora cf. gigantea A]|uniref:uncharacterized protein n=1 Tax=Porospora cf. gigantea A TaxID=2853593 RepID=UPI00355A79B3|nr:MAG: hypothetical protein KVP18_000800 [Porospora cf. gigantea A]
MRTALLFLALFGDALRLHEKPELKSGEPPTTEPPSEAIKKAGPTPDPVIEKARKSPVSERESSLKDVEMKASELKERAEDTIRKEKSLKNLTDSYQDVSAQLGKKENEITERASNLIGNFEQAKERLVTAVDKINAMEATLTSVFGSRAEEMSRFPEAVLSPKQKEEAEAHMKKNKTPGELYPLFCPKGFCPGDEYMECYKYSKVVDENGNDSDSVECAHFQDASAFQCPKHSTPCFAAVTKHDMFRTVIKGHNVKVTVEGLNIGPGLRLAVTRKACVSKRTEDLEDIMRDFEKLSPNGAGSPDVTKAHKATFGPFRINEQGEFNICLVQTLPKPNYHDEKKKDPHTAGMLVVGIDKIGVIVVVDK